LLQNKTFIEVLDTCIMLCTDFTCLHCALASF